MSTKELYENHYQQNKWVDQKRFKRLRRWLYKYDVGRYDGTARLLEGAGGGSLLDIGCGKGNLLKLLSGRFNRLVGVDISPTAVNSARKALAPYPNVTVETQDIDAGLPFPDGAFDVVTMTACLEHVVDVFGALREINRVLKANGSLVVGVPNIGYIKHRWSLLCGRLPVTSADPWEKVGWDGGHLHYFTYRTFGQALAYCGFTVEQFGGEGLLAGCRKWWPSLLLGDISVRAKKIGQPVRDRVFSHD